MIFDLQDKNGFSLIPNKMLNIPWGGIQPYSYFSGNEQDSFIVIMANDSISNYYLVRAVENNNQIVFSDKDCSTIAFNSDWTIETVFEHSQIDDATIEKILSSYLGVWPEKFRKAISELEEFNLFKAELNKLNEVDLVIDSEWLCKGRVINPCFVRPYQPAGYLEGKTVIDATDDSKFLSTGDIDLEERIPISGGGEIDKKALIYNEHSDCSKVPLFSNEPST